MITGGQPGAKMDRLKPSFWAESSADLPSVAQQMIGQHDRQHRLSHRYGADADTRIVSPFGRDFRLFAAGGDRLAGGEDRAGRLDREPHDDVLARGYAAQDSAGIVRAEGD